MSSIVFNSIIYLSLSSYLVGLCVFIPVWVCTCLGWQIIDGMDLSAARNEVNAAEWAWTLVPTLLVMYLCGLNTMSMVLEVPSAVDGVVKVTGRQWYWSYEIQDSERGYDSILTDLFDSVDKPLRLYMNNVYCFLVTSADVIHSFALPSVNLKVDAIPGRINQGIVQVKQMGVHVGYCSELCGAGHAYMPIVAECIAPQAFLSDLARLEAVKLAATQQRKSGGFGWWRLFFYSF